MAGLSQKDTNDILKDIHGLEYLFVSLNVDRNEYPDNGSQIEKEWDYIKSAIKTGKGLGEHLASASKLMKRGMEKSRDAVHNKAELYASLLKSCVAAESISKRWERCAKIAS